MGTQDPDSEQWFWQLWWDLDRSLEALEANGQTAWLIDQAFPGADTSDFAGSVRCEGGDNLSRPGAYLGGVGSA